MDKKINNHDISSRRKRQIAQKETEIDYSLLESSSGVIDFGPLDECIKKCRIENDQSSSVLTSSSPSNDQLPNFSDNNNEEEYSNEVHNADVVTDDEDFIDIEERGEMQSLSLDSDNSSDDAGDNMNIDDKSMDNEFLYNLRNWSFEYKIRHNAINALMEILRHAPHSQFKTLPKNARMLLKTPKKTTEIVALAEESYYRHFGLSNTLEVFLQHYKTEDSALHISIIMNPTRPTNVRHEESRSARNEDHDSHSILRSRTEEERLRRRREWQRQQERERQHEKLKQQKILEYERKRAQALGYAEPKSVHHSRSKSSSKSPQYRHRGRSSTSASKSGTLFEKLEGSTSGTIPLFKGPEGIQFSTTELRRIKVDIRRSIPVKGPIPDLQRSIVNAEDVILKRREGKILTFSEILFFSLKFYLSQKLLFNIQDAF